MSSPYVKLGDRTLDQWKVTELKEELKRRKLTTKGLKEDLVKRLDEVIRMEMKSMENEENDATQSELPSEQAKTDSDVSGMSKDFVDREIDNVEKVNAKPEDREIDTVEKVDAKPEDREIDIVEKVDAKPEDREIDIVEKVDAKPEHESNDNKESLGEGKVMEADSVQGDKPAGLEQEEVAQFSATETISVVSESVKPMTALSESHSQSHVTNEDGDSSVLLNNDGYSQEDAKVESSDPNTESPWVNESSMPVAPVGAPNLQDSETQDSETQNEANRSTDQGEKDDLQPDSSVQPLKYQVSEVDPDLGFQVTSDSVSTESVSINEKNELKIDVITDNVQLELDVKHEMVPPSPSRAVPDGGESHPMDVEKPLIKNNIEEPIDRKDVQEPLGKNEDTETNGGSNALNIDSLKDIDSGDLGPPEKLSLDRSSGDDSMEEDMTESKQMEYKSDSFTDNVEKSGKPSMKEEEHVDVVGHDKPVETKVSNAENETAAMTSGKRKFQDKEAVGNNDTVKKVRRWNAEGIKRSELQRGSITPKGLSEPSLKPISGTNSTANAEAPKERLVPPSSRPPTNSLRIDRFLRPFTLKAVQELLGKTGSVTSFWMDHIKTHCYVSYASVEEAVETRNAVYNLQWPPNGGRLLVAEFVDPQEVKSRVEAPLASPKTPSTSAAPTQPQPGVQHEPSPRQQVPRQQLPPPSLPPPPLSNPPLAKERLHPPREPPPREQPLPARDRLILPPPPPLPEKVDPPIVTLDDLFRKTKATPRIYYLPLTNEQVASKLKAQGKNVKSVDF